MSSIHHALRRTAAVLAAPLAGLAIAGCSSFASLNTCLPGTAGCLAAGASNGAGASEPPAAAPAAIERARGALRTTLAVDGHRGNGRMLMFLALSGGGSRAAYMSAETMIALRQLPQADLLGEVDVVSAVSGGSLAAAYYAATRDRSLSWQDENIGAALEGAFSVRAEVPAQLALAIAGRGPDAVGPVHHLSCTAALDDAARQWLRDRLQPALGSRHLARVENLCREAAMSHLRHWDDNDARERLGRNYVVRLVGNLLWPGNFLRYWFTAFDRSDIMAQTLSDSLFDEPVFGTDHRLRDLNETRPYLIVSATNATDRSGANEHEDTNPYRFGTAFTFTREDFAEHLRSDISTYPVGQAVMASSAFPLAFPHVTLRDFRPLRTTHRCPTGEDRLAMCDDDRYVHVFDGGNSDNLGLRAVRRILLQMALDDTLAQYDSVVVLLVDAFTVPEGADSRHPDPRSLLGRLVDPNGVTEAVDALLQANRLTLIDAFDRPDQLLDWGKDCRGVPQLPDTLCERLRAADKEALGERLAERLVFYHFGFDDVPTEQDAPDLKQSLNRIPTSLAIGNAHEALLRQAVGKVINPANPCLQQIARLANNVEPAPDVFTAQQICRGFDIRPQPGPAPGGPAASMQAAR